MIQGQINRGSLLGEKIYQLCLGKDVNNIVDIGTWNGMGTTKCIYDAVVGTRKNVWSLECNKVRHEEAKMNLGLLPPNFKLLHGTIVNYEELSPLMDELTDDTLKTWLKDDLACLASTPNVMDQLPEHIDVCVIDGGEFSGDIEFFRLWERCKWIVLDDTNALKHKKTKQFILRNPTMFRVVEDNTIHRNGYLICEVL